MPRQAGRKPSLADWLNDAKTERRRARACSPPAALRGASAACNGASEEEMPSRQSSETIRQSLCCCLPTDCIDALAAAMRKATTCLLCTSVALLTYTCTLLPSHFSSYSYAWHAAPPDQSIFSPSNTELSLHSALPDFDGDELNWQLDPNLGAAPAAVIETMAGQAPLSWISGSFPAWTNNSLAAVRWSDYNELEYSFAETTPDSSVPGFSARLDETEYMREFTRIAKANGVRPTLAVGGWTGSRFVGLTGCQTSVWQHAD